MTKSRFTGNFTQQDALPETALDAALNVLKSGRLHRYNLEPGEEGETAAFEREYAAWQGVDYALAVTSGGQAMQIALRAAGVKAGDAVLTNAFTLAPVPGAIAAVGGEPVFVEIGEDLRLDIEDFALKATQSGAKFLLLSHMRGHLCDMDAVMQITNSQGITVIEDCAHTMGATWDGKLSGNFGQVACFSTQTYKHINSGEGGVLTTNDPHLAARATILSGSYMLYTRHGAGPGPEFFDDARLDMPNNSARMDALRAAILRPQLAGLHAKITEWNRLCDAFLDRVRSHPAIHVPHAPNQEMRVGSSAQFRVPGLDQPQCERLIAACADRGVEIKWFGRSEPHGFTSDHQSWRYATPQELPKTGAVLAQLFDIRVPLTFSTADCELIADIIIEEVSVITGVLANGSN